MIDFKKEVIEMIYYLTHAEMIQILGSTKPRFNINNYELPEPLKDISKKRWRLRKDPKAKETALIKLTEIEKIAGADLHKELKEYYENEIENITFHEINIFTFIKIVELHNKELKTDESIPAFERHFYFILYNKITGCYACDVNNTIKDFESLSKVNEYIDKNHLNNENFKIIPCCRKEVKNG